MKYKINSKKKEKMKKITISVIFLFILISNVFAQNKAITRINAKQLFNYPAKISTSLKSNPESTLSISTDNQIKLIQINAQNFNDFASMPQQVITVDEFPVSPTENKSVTFQRLPPVVDAHTEWLRGTDHGIVHEKPLTITSFMGKIEGDTASKVFLTYINNQVYCMIDKSTGEKLSITPMLQSTDKVNTPHILTSETLKATTDKKSNPFVCLTEENIGNLRETPDKYKNENQLLYSGKLLEAHIALEGTYDYYTLMGSDYDAAAAHMAAVLAVSSKIYERDLDVMLYVSSVLIWDSKTSDPYRNTSTISDKLQIMPNVWSSYTTHRTVACLFAYLWDQPAGTTVAGIAYAGSPFTGTLCDNSQGFCVVGITNATKPFPTTNYTWDVNVVTHEVGHTFSAPHTHNCYYDPPIDTCIIQGQYDGCVPGPVKPVPGTIMSYCHLVNSTGTVQLYFHPRSIALMRVAAEHASCMGTPTSAKLELLSPLV